MPIDNFYNSYLGINLLMIVAFKQLSNDRYKINILEYLLLDNFFGFSEYHKQYMD